MEKLRAQVAKDLLNHNPRGNNAIRLEPTKVVIGDSAHIAPLYASLRVYQSYPLAMGRLVELIDRHIAASQFHFQVIAPASESAGPLVARISGDLNIPMVTPRFNENQYGPEGDIDGDYKYGDRALMVEDTLVREGNRKRTTILKMRKRGLLCNNLFVVMNRSANKTPYLSMSDDIYLDHLYTMSELFRFYDEEDAISSRQKLHACRKYIDDFSIA